MNEALDGLKPASEEVTIAGRKYFVTELEYASDISNFRNETDGTMHLLVQSVRDESGNLLWSVDDIPKLRKSSRKRIGELINAAMRVNGLDDKASEEKPVAQS